MQTTAPALDVLGRHAPAPSFDDPIGMLLACHVRMRRQLDTLAKLQRYEHAAGPAPDAQAIAAAQAVMKYFDRAAVDHHADEDRSLLPRVKARVPALTPLVESMGREHRELERRWRKLRPLLSSIASGIDPGLPPRLVREVCEGYAAHLDREERELIPRAVECLDAEALAAMGRELAARRALRN